ncbi:MAG: hypothetical protein JXL84_14500, partial [Deltaproteobacteria bacterium]|nr:hypothetical protein [Deltaproteobacteria bacterium]
LVFLWCYAWDVHPVGSTQWMLPAPVDYGGDRGILKIQDAVKESFYKPRIRHYYTITLPKSNTGWILYWYYKRYMDFEHRFLGDVGGVIDPKGIVQYGVPIGVGKLAFGWEMDAYLHFMGMKDGRRIFLSRRIDHKSIHAFLEDARGTENHRNTYEVEYYDGDRLRLRVEARDTLFVNFIDNWDPDWHVWVDGKEVALKHLFGTFKAVRVSPGLWQVDFKYRPF